MGSYLEFKQINKYFPGVHALSDFSLKADSGIVYAIVGENGAGKSTLLKILNGDYLPDSGEFFIDGVQQKFTKPSEAISAGVSVIYQERQIILEMTVAENVFLGDWPCNKAGKVDYERMNKETEEIAKSFGLDIAPDVKVKSLSIALQQMVEVMKAVNRNSKIIAFDEPTASLSGKEIEILFKIIRKLQAEQKVIFYVSHRMDEISQIAQKVVVLKDGKFVAMRDQENVTDDELIRLMVGRPLGSVFQEIQSEREIGEVVLEVKNLTTHSVKDISFSLRRGEILGFAGLVGSGRTEIMQALFGLDHILSGEIIYDGQRYIPSTPTHAIEVGIAMVPEDRKTQGIMPNISVRGNITISILRKLLNKFKSIDVQREEIIAQENIQKLSIKTPDSDKLIAQLSGGNQQKVILARWLVTHPKVLILDEPTKGIDVGAKAEFYRIISECAKNNIAVIVISSELPEVIGLCDRIIVIRNGSISGEVNQTSATEENILKYAMIDLQETK